MSEPRQFPNRTVVTALWRAGMAMKEKTSSIAGEFGDRWRTQIETGNLHGPAGKDALKILNKGLRNEVAGLDYIAHLRVYLDWVEEDIKNQGHTGDFDTMSRRVAEAEAAAAPAEEPAEEGAKSARRGRRKKASEDEVEAASFRAAVRENNEKGQAHIRQVAGAAEDDDELPPPPDEAPAEPHTPAKADGGFRIIN